MIESVSVMGILMKTGYIFLWCYSEMYREMQTN